MSKRLVFKVLNQRMDMKVFGAKAKVYIKFDGNLLALGKVISKGLQIPDFWIKDDTELPYSSTAMSEAFGFESWLKKVDDDSWDYKFEMSTMHSTGEMFSGDMYDLSEWLRRYLEDICDLKVKI